MTDNNYFKASSYNVICDICGQKYKREQCRYSGKGYTNQNLLVCFHCYDPVHPWSIPQPIAVDSLPVPDARPRPASVNVTVQAQDIGAVGVRYLTSQGFQSNVIIGSWTVFLGGNDGLQLTSDNFPLV